MVHFVQITILGLRRITAYLCNNGNGKDKQKNAIIPSPLAMGAPRHPTDPGDPSNRTVSAVFQEDVGLPREIIIRADLDTSSSLINISSPQQQWSNQVMAGWIRH